MANKDFSKKGLAVALGAIIGAGVLNSVSVTAMEEDIVKSKSPEIFGVVMDGLNALDDKANENINWTNLTNFQKTLNEKMEEAKLITPNTENNIHKLLQKMMTIALRDLKGVSNFIDNLLKAEAKILDDNQFGTHVNMTESIRQTTTKLLDDLKTKFEIKDTDLN